MEFEIPKPVTDTVFYKRASDFLENFLQAYDECSYWIDKSIFDHCKVRYVFLLPTTDMRSLVEEIGERLREMGEVWLRKVNPDLFFMHIEGDVISNTLMFLERHGRVAMLGVTKIKSHWRSLYPKFKALGVIAYAIVSVSIVGLFNLPPLVKAFFTYSTLIGLVGGGFLFGFIEIPVNYRRCVSHSKKVIPLIKEAAGEVCSKELAFKGSFPTSFPTIAHYDVGHLKTRLGIKG